MSDSSESKPPAFPRKRPVRALRPEDAHDLIITPGGLRPRSRVHVLEPGQHVDTTSGRIRIIDDATGEVVKDLGESEPTEAEEGLAGGAIEGLKASIPALADVGWIENSQWRNGGVDPIIYFSTTWVVPPEPASQDNQTVYLFNAVQPDNAAHIIQPVLQWGSSNAGGGNYWSISNWYADGQFGASTAKSPTKVNPGDVLIGIITCTAKTVTASGTTYTYQSSFVGHPEVDLVYTTSELMTWAYETLEAYGPYDSTTKNFDPLSQCGDYPPVPFTTMYDIEIKTGTPGSAGTDAAIVWTPVTNFNSCGQICTVGSNNSPGGFVNLFYRTHPWFLIHPEIKMQPGAAVTALWRSNQTHLDLFATGTDGAVWSTWWEGASGWQPWFLIHPEIKMQPGATVTALWRSNETHLDLFVTGTDGAVWSTWWEGAPGWQPWFLIHPEIKMQVGATVTALWRSNDAHLDLFVTGTDGAVWSTWWEGTPGWQSWFLIHPEIKMQPGATLSALWRSDDTHLDLFATGTDGAVWSTWWEGAPGWQPWFLIHPEIKMQVGATVTALWRSNQTHLDLFVTGTDGAVWSTWWEGPTGWQPWFLIHPEIKMQPGATVTALWRSNDAHLDLFVTGTDGAVWSTWWEGPTGWQSWFLIWDPIWNNIRMRPGVPISALWRSNDTHLDLFTTGTDGAVWSIWWEPAAGW